MHSQRPPASRRHTLVFRTRRSGSSGVTTTRTCRMSAKSPKTSITGSTARSSLGRGPPLGRASRTASSSALPRTSGAWKASHIVASGAMFASIAARSPARNPSQIAPTAAQTASRSSASTRGIVRCAGGMTETRRTSIEEARRVGDEIGVDWARFELEQFRKGMDVEFEHGSHDPQTDVTHDDPIVTGKIALAHMKEFPDYYERLERMERVAERECACKPC